MQKPCINPAKELFQCFAKLSDRSPCHQGRYSWHLCKAQGCKKGGSACMKCQSPLYLRRLRASKIDEVEVGQGTRGRAGTAAVAGRLDAQAYDGVAAAAALVEHGAAHLHTADGSCGQQPRLHAATCSSQAEDVSRESTGSAVTMVAWVWLMHCNNQGINDPHAMHVCQTKKFLAQFNDIAEDCQSVCLLHNLSRPSNSGDE